MAMQNLVAGECGGPNPLMKLANKVQEGRTPHQLIQGRNVHEGNIPQTFHMQHLLNEMQQIERPSGMANIDVMAGNEWQRDYAQRSNERYIIQDNTVSIWQKEFSKNEAASNHRSIQHHHHTDQQPIMYYPPQRYTPLMQPRVFNENYISPAITMNQSRVHNENFKWAHEYLDENIESYNDESSGMQKTAKEIVESMEDKQINNTEFMKFVDRIKDGASVEGASKNKLADVWVNEYQNKPATEGTLDEEEQIVDDFTQEDADYWDKLQQDWNELFSQEQFHNEEENTINSKDYVFEAANPFAGINNAFEEGVKKLDAGDLISAILLFEEAVKIDEGHAEAWQYLGTSQAENEQEMLAIKALNKCLELKPENQTARMALAVSYTNESLQLQALNELKSWIQHHPRYSHLPANTVIKQSHLASSLMSADMFKKVQDLYLAAARLSPQGDFDADIQIGLGVLFNISSDYKKAVDCFNAGLQARPDSATLWNKLGATLANSGRSAEAIDAYGNALQLRPGFIRSRYNLGISCINMKAYNEAIEHFLIALNMQKQGEDPSRPASTMSENIWTTLRMSLSLLGKLDLMKAVDDRNLAQLNNVFKIHES